MVFLGEGDESLIMNTWRIIDSDRPTPYPSIGISCPDRSLTLLLMFKFAIVAVVVKFPRRCVDMRWLLIRRDLLKTFMPEYYEDVLMLVDVNE